jgi:hypothetical protein
MSGALLSPIVSIEEHASDVDLSDEMVTQGDQITECSPSPHASPSCEEPESPGETDDRGLGRQGAVKAPSTLRLHCDGPSDRLPTGENASDIPPITLDPFFASMDSDVRSSGITGRRPSPAIPWINAGGNSHGTDPLPHLAESTSDVAAGANGRRGEAMVAPEHRSRNVGCNRGRTLTERLYPSVVGTPARPITEAEKGFISAIHRTLRWRNWQEMESFYRYWDEWVH